MVHTGCIVQNPVGQRWRQTDEELLTFLLFFLFFLPPPGFYSRSVVLFLSLWNFYSSFSSTAQFNSDVHHVSLCFRTKHAFFFLKSCRSHFTPPPASPHRRPHPPLSVSPRRSALSLCSMYPGAVPDVEADGTDGNHRSEQLYFSNGEILLFHEPWSRMLCVPSVANTFLSWCFITTSFTWLVSV